MPPIDAPAARVRLRDLDPLVHRLLIGNGFSSIGSGLTMPFLYVYLAHVRGIETAVIGLLFAWMGVVGLLTAPLGGTLIDRFGPRPIMAAGLVAEALAVASLAVVRSATSAFVVATAITLGTVGLWPAMTALMTRLVPPAARERVYGVQFMTLNAGLGIGGLISATLVDVTRPQTFERLYVLDAATYLVLIAIVLSFPRGTGALRPAEGEDGAETAVAVPGWRTVLADRTVLWLTATCVIAVTFGYAQMEAGFAAYSVDVAGVPPNALGLAFGANTAVIVVGQLATLRFIEGRSRSRLLALAALLWGLSWAVIALAAPAGGTAAVVCAILGMGIFGLAETLWAPVAPAVFNAMAPEELRGRYNALQSMVWTISSIIGPAMAGLLIGHGLAGWWVGATIGGTVLAAVGFARLHGRLSALADGRGAPADGGDGGLGSLVQQDPV